VAKRFTDTELYDKPWFMILSCRLKCAVEYLFKKCDATGVWEPNYILAATYVGDGGFTEQELFSIDGGKQFEKLPNGKIFLPGFCDFQYGVLTEACRPHRPIIQKLKKHGLYERVLIGYQKGINTLEEKDKDKDKEQDKEKDFGKSENLLPDPGPLPMPEPVPRGIVPDMLQAFIELNQGYPVNQEADFPALREVGNKIVAWLKLPGDLANSENQPDVRRRWGELVTHAKAHSLYQGFSIGQINKHFQSICQSFNTGKNGAANQQPHTGSNTGKLGTSEARVKKTKEY
jgi:hypothetical protein